MAFLRQLTSEQLELAVGREQLISGYREVAGGQTTLTSMPR